MSHAQTLPPMPGWMSCATKYGAQYRLHTSRSTALNTLSRYGGALFELQGDRYVEVYRTSDAEKVCEQCRMPVQFDRYGKREGSVRWVHQPKLHRLFRHFTCPQ